MSFLQRLLSADFAPHGYCFLWFPEILWLHVVSDALIAVAYFAIPIALLVLARRRRELPFPWLFVMFAAFITACGLTHLMGIWTMWRPDYGVEGLLKAACALISLATAALLIPVMPKALALRSPRELEAVNGRLADEVDRHRSTSGELARAHAELEARVAERTAELVASEARYRALVEAFASVVWSTDARGMVEDNPDWRALTGQSVGEGRGLGWLEALHPEDRTPTRAAWKAALAGGRAYDVEYRLRIRDGRWRWYNARGVPVRDQHGAIREWVGVCIDIDERKRAESALRESEERYRTLVETSPDAVYVHQAGRIVLANRQAVALLGATSPDQLVGLGSDEIVDEASQELSRARVARLVAPGAQNDLTELTFRRLDGERLPAEVASAAVQVDGRLAVLVVFRDITARKTAEQHQQLLLQELSHRVKNTLAVVQSIAARSFADGRSLAEARAALSRRLQALAHAHTLLTASKWEGASLRTLVEAELRPYAGRVEIVGQDIRLTPKETLTLSLVLHELATNAAKHGALSVPEGRVTIGWDLARNSSGMGLHLEWQEQDGPTVSPPQRHGFGTVLVEQAVAYDLQGQARLDFQPTGFRYQLEAALGLAA
jgi:PAS domain S-box-containing protein